MKDLIIKNTTSINIKEAWTTIIKANKNTYEDEADGLIQNAKDKNIIYYMGEEKYAEQELYEQMEAKNFLPYNDEIHVNIKKGDAITMGVVYLNESNFNICYMEID